MRHAFAGLLVLVLTCGLPVLGVAMDPMVQQAQEQLIRLGYDPGTVDGVYGPRTRQALEAFQRAQNLPVTGVLDEPTFQALQQAVSPPTISSPSSAPLSRSPLQVVVDYLRFHELQPGRVLPYVTERFLNGTPPSSGLNRRCRNV
jgi:peptidoglycan hydrolase-like protein with peptidoglycan-binding domain